jgi:hypothetical protein
MVHVRTESLHHRILGSKLEVGKTERRQSHLTMRTRKLSTFEYISFVIPTRGLLRCFFFFISSASLLSLFSFSFSFFLFPHLPHFFIFSFSAEASGVAAAATLCTNTSESLGYVIIRAHAGTAHFFGGFGFSAGNTSELGVRELTAEDKGAVDPQNETAHWDAGPELKVGRCMWTKREVGFQD